jgi:hypothetical protein
LTRLYNSGVSRTKKELRDTPVRLFQDYSETSGISLEKMQHEFGID